MVAHAMDQTLEGHVRPGRSKYMIVYGETMPAWTKYCATMDDVHKWVGRCMAVGDVIFRIEQLT